MAKLTTEASSEDFNYDIEQRLREFPHLAGNLALEHRKMVGVSRSTKTAPFNNPEYPDTESFVVGFSMIASQLIRLAAKIEETENIAEDFDDGSDESERQHALGELFALKETYISFSSGMGALESARLTATKEGLTHKTFLSLVSQTPDGVPTKDQMTGQVITGNRINDPSLFRRGAAAYHPPQTTGWLRPNTPNGTSLSVKSPPASAKIPPIPPLV